LFASVAGVSSITRSQPRTVGIQFQDWYSRVEGKADPKMGMASKTGEVLKEAPATRTSMC
jgi:hypothetical protein